MSYDRPNQAWTCGHADDGNPCPLGPSRLGLCQHSGDCHPIEREGQWICNRSQLHGGPCDHGPNADGECGIQRPPCKPQPSLRVRRGVFAISCFAVAIALLMVMLSAPWRIEALAPGPLASSHAQILNRHVGANRCSACHAAGDESLADWLVPAALRYANGNEPKSRSQSDLCLHCHDNSFDRMTALVPHGISLTELQGLSDASSSQSGLKTVGSKSENRIGNLACSTCHREHHGAMHNLSELSNKQCASCHVNDFDRFEEHTEFVNWPFRRRTRIAFDHTSHEFKHFTKNNTSFECNSCHIDSSRRDVLSIVSFESCRSCHESNIVSPNSNGIAFFSLPMIDVQAFKKAGIDVGAWPNGATGGFDGALPPAMRMLLSADPKARNALEQFEAPFDFLDVDSTNRDQIKNAAEIVFGIKRLMRRLSRPRADASDSDVPSASLRQVEDAVPTFVIGSAMEKWLSPVDARSELEQNTTSVGWFRDDDAFTIGYRPLRHDDPVMRVLYETLASDAEELGASAQQLFTDLRQPTATGQCASCHSIDKVAGRVEIHWWARQANTKKQFTEFSHRPHLLQPQLRDCTACHEPDRTADVAASYATMQPQGHASNFRNIKRAACANCHAPKAAGDSCLQCHNYHIDSPHAFVDDTISWSSRFSVFTSALEAR